MAGDLTKHIRDAFAWYVLRPIRKEMRALDRAGVGLARGAAGRQALADGAEHGR